MQIRPGLGIDDEVVAAVVSRHGIRRLAVFGSALRDDFGPDSAVDLLVEFDRGRTPGFLGLAAMEIELGELLGREVDLRTDADLGRYSRDTVRHPRGRSMLPSARLRPRRGSVWRASVGSVTADEDQVAALRRVVADVAAMPYVWPGDPSAAAARAAGAGTCASKHALLAEELAELGITSRPVLVVGPLVPALLAGDPAFADACHLPEVHELLTVSVPGVGPCRVDVTWDPPLVRAGLPGQVGWDGRSDMALAVGETTEWWAPAPERLREEKEALRARIYAPGEREVRDAALEALSERLAALRR